MASDAPRPKAPSASADDNQDSVGDGHDVRSITCARTDREQNSEATPEWSVISSRHFVSTLQQFW
jgi:hypothetical protein